MNSTFLATSVPILKMYQLLMCVGNEKNFPRSCDLLPKPVIFIELFLRNLLASFVHLFKLTNIGYIDWQSEISRTAQNLSRIRCFWSVGFYHIFTLTNHEHSEYHLEVWLSSLKITVLQYWPLAPLNCLFCGSPELALLPLTDVRQQTLT